MATLGGSAQRLFPRCYVDGITIGICFLLEGEVGVQRGETVPNSKLAFLRQCPQFSPVHTGPGDVD